MFNYTFKEKLLIKFSQKFMPILSTLIPSNRLITIMWRLLGVKVGKGSIITRDTRINVPFNLEIGNFSIINGEILNREKVVIGNYVEMLLDVYLSTQSHDLKNAGHLAIYKPVIINDFCWIAPRSIILQGVHLKKGTVVAANSVVTKSNNNEYDILAGIPAKVISKRKLFDEKYKENLIDSKRYNLYQYFQHRI